MSHTFSHPFPLKNPLVPTPMISMCTLSKVQNRIHALCLLFPVKQVPFELEWLP